jgi:hypothetical protein
VMTRTIDVPNVVLGVTVVLTGVEVSAVVTRHNH